VGCCRRPANNIDADHHDRPTNDSDSHHGNGRFPVVVDCCCCDFLLFSEAFMNVKTLVILAVILVAVWYLNKKFHWVAV